MSNEKTQLREREKTHSHTTHYSLLLQVLQYLPPLSLSRLLLTATRCSSSYDLVHTHHMYGTVLFGGHSVVILQPTKNHSTFILYCTVLREQLRTTSQTRFYHSTILFSVLLYTIKRLHNSRLTTVSESIVSMLSQ